jgi:UDP-N-acetyl-D-glucosamine dehydrogenase
MKVGIIGLGYVGLPLAVAFAEAGHEVVGLDTDARKIEALREGRSYIEDVPSEALAPLSERIHPTASHADLASCNSVILCVPTPLTGSREPDLTCARRRSSSAAPPRPAPRAPASCIPRSATR